MRIRKKNEINHSKNWEHSSVLELASWAENVCHLTMPILSHIWSIVDKNNSHVRIIILSTTMCFYLHFAFIRAHFENGFSRYMYANWAVIQVMMERDVVFLPTKHKSSITNSNNKGEECRQKLGNSNIFTSSTLLNCKLCVEWTRYGTPSTQYQSTLELCQDYHYMITKVACAKSINVFLLHVPIYRERTYHSICSCMNIWFVLFSWY